MESADTFELLHIEEYAKRIKVGRTTIFKWKREGILVPGRHFIKRGKIVRFIWEPNLIREIHENTEKQSGNSNQQGISSTQKSLKTRNKSSINFEY